MSLKKMVNGIEVGMSPEEEAATRAEWAANDAMAAAAKPKADPVAKLKSFLSANPDVMAAIEIT